MPARSRSFVVAVALALLAVTAAACSGDDASPDATATRPPFAALTAVALSEEPTAAAEALPAYARGYDAADTERVLNGECPLRISKEPLAENVTLGRVTFWLGPRTHGRHMLVFEFLDAEGAYSHFGMKMGPLVDGREGELLLISGQHVGTGERLLFGFGYRTGNFTPSALGSVTLQETAPDVFIPMGFEGTTPGVYAITVSLDGEVQGELRLVLCHEMGGNRGPLG